MITAVFFIAFKKEITRLEWIWSPLKKAQTWSCRYYILDVLFWWILRDSSKAVMLIIIAGCRNHIKGFSVSRCEMFLSSSDSQSEANRFHNWAIFFDEQNFCVLQRTRLGVLNCKEMKVIYLIFSNTIRVGSCLVPHEYWIQQLKCEIHEET